MIKDVVRGARSRRRFDNSTRVSHEVLVDLIDAARLTPSAGNLQRVRFLPVSSAVECDAIFPHLRWAGYLADWQGPDAAERPVAYIVLCQDDSVGPVSDVDLGIVAQTINLVAAGDCGLAVCMIGAFDRDGVRSAVLSDCPGVSPLLVLAIGHPAERVEVCDAIGGDVRYWRTPEGVHRVPKLSLEERLVSHGGR